MKFKNSMEVIRNMKQSDNAFLGLGVKFPALVDAPGVAPWNPNQLDIWAAESEADANAVHAARFLLNLWMPAREWQCGRFDMNEAIQNGIEFIDEHSLTGLHAKRTSPDRTHG
jgi:hypothetical protein